MGLSSLDAQLFTFINQSLANGFFDSLFPLITRKAWMLLLPLFLVTLFKERKTAVTAFVLGLISFLLADWIANSLKYFFGRVRPCHVLEGARLLVGCGTSFSMPSNHAVNAFAFIMPFYLKHTSPIRYFFIAAAVLVGFSRVYVGVHYPSDVVVGAMVGICVSVSVVKASTLLSKRWGQAPHTTLLFIFLLAISLFRIYYIQHGPLDLSPDEAHYWEWSRRLDLSYYSKGPMIAYLIWFGTALFGDTEFGIRSMAVLFSALSSLVLYHFCKNISNEKVGVLSALSLQIVPLFSAYGVIFTIDSPFVFFWILSLFLLHRAMEGHVVSSGAARASSPQSKAHADETAPSKKSEGSRAMLWIATGISVGLGLLTKYTMAFFPICAVLFLLGSKDKRRLLLTPGPYLALAVSLLVFSPVIIWNAAHDWVTFRHTAGHAQLAEGLRVSPLSFIEFVGSQIGVITPVLFVLFVIALIRLRRDLRGSFLFWFSVPILLFFLLKSIQGKVQANWPLPAYVTALVACSRYSLEGPLHDTRKRRTLLAIALIIALSVTAVGHYPRVFGLPLSLDPTVRLAGWRQLGQEVSDIYDRMSRERPVFIFSDRYQIASELAFYVRGQPVTYCANLDRRMNQYDLWPSFDALVYYDAIFVKAGDVPLPEAIGRAFRQVEKKVFSTYTNRHEKIKDYSIFLCYDFKGLDQAKPKRY